MSQAVTDTDLITTVRSAIENARGDDPFAEVWLMAPHARAGESLTVRLARSGGYVNVRALTSKQVISELVGPQRASLSRLSSSMQREILRQILSRARAPLATSHGAQVVDSFVKAMRELRGRTEAERLLLAESPDPLTRELLHLYAQYRARIEGRFLDEQDLYELALVLDVDHPPVVAVVTEPPEWQYNELLNKLVSREGSTAILVETGEANIDEPSRVWMWGIDGRRLQVGLKPVSENLDVVVAPDARCEVDIVVANLLNKAEQGVSFADMAILCPDLSAHRSIALTSLRAAGIPFRGRIGTRLFQTPLGAFLTRTIDVINTDFSVDALQRWFSDPCFVNPADASRPKVGDWADALRRAGALGGATEIVERLRVLEASLTRPSDERVKVAASACAAIVTDLEALIGEAPVSWLGWATLLQRSIERYVGSFEQRKSWPRLSQEIAQSVEGCLKALESLDSVSSSEVKLDEVRDTLVSMLERSVPAASDSRGVLVGSFSDAVCADFAYVAVCGLNEGLVPNAGGIDGLQAALAVPGEEPPIERQRRAFLHVLSSASSVTLTCARADQRAQRERLPSPWLLEQAGRLAGERVTARQLFEQRELWPWLQVVPSYSATLTFDDNNLVSTADRIQLSSMKRWFDSSAEIFAHPVVDTDGLAGSLEMIRARSSDQLTRFDGFVGVHNLAVQISGEPASVSHLEKWATCPAQYFYSKLLSLTKREDDDTQVGFSARARGLLIHDVLERFFQSVDRRSSPDQKWSEDERGLLHKIGDELLNQLDESTSENESSVLLSIEARQLHMNLDRFLDADALIRSRKQVVTVAAESGFGGRSDKSAVIDRSGKQPVMFRGRIDRIDESADGLHRVVVDYKSGKKQYMPSAGQLAKDPTIAGQKLQLAAYAEAVRSNPDQTIEAMYWFVADKLARDPIVGLTYDDNARARFYQVVDDIASGIESGLFAAVPGDEDRESFKNCRLCEFDDICRSDRDELWDRKQFDPAAEPLARLSNKETSSS